MGTQNLNEMNKDFYFICFIFSFQIALLLTATSDSDNKCVVLLYYEFLMLTLLSFQWFLVKTLNAKLSDAFSCFASVAVVFFYSCRPCCDS